MPEESKKNQHKGAKDQRKPRNRHQAGPTDKKVDKKADEPKVPPQKPPVYEEPGPEFYKNLKRETDEILKITEEANSKYKKKEIQSNWSKYEMPIESYDEIEEQENMGADYEKLIEAPLSIGGHFQFKHEKSWDVNTGPSLYDKYFDVNMDNLFVSIATIPFQERLNVNKSIFSETDILTMNNRATRFKNKYFGNKFMTPELNVQDSVISSLKETNLEPDEAIEIEEEQVLTKENIADKILDLTVSNIQLEKECANENETVVDGLNDPKNSNYLKPLQTATPKPKIEELIEDIDNFEELILDSKEMKPQELESSKTPVTSINEVKKDVVAEQPKLSEPPKNTVIESPEDLEKWLDDFLDG